MSLPVLSLGLTDALGALAERYEYTPYGQRTVFVRGWMIADMNDDGYVDAAEKLDK